jgi:threonine dehydrogenase-like Zn-dependent dehydrogenase
MDVSVIDWMRAVAMTETGVSVSREYPRPKAGEGEVLVRVLRAGICDTDLQIMRGYMGFRGILGHEFVGVAQSGSYSGRRVASEINVSCARCEMCQGGLANHCPTRTVLGILGHDGAFADYVAVPERNLHVVPTEIGVDEAVFIEPLAAAFQIPRQIPIDRRAKTLVLGDGKLGNLVAQVLKSLGCQVLVAGKHPEKLRIIERLGVGTELVNDLRRVRNYGLVIDCTGSPTGLPAALEFVRPRGVIVLKTTVAATIDLTAAPIVIDEITVIGSRCGPFPTAIEALRSKKIEVAPLIHDVYRLTDATAALDAASQNGSLKILLAVDEATPSIKRIRT